MSSISQLVSVSTSRRVRRAAIALASRFTYRRFIFALSATAVLAAKTVHIYAHLAALSTVDVLRWGCSFYAQDTAVLLLARQLLEDGPSVMPSWFRIAKTTLTSALAAFALLVATISISFWAVAGSELQWRNIGLASDSSSWSMLLSGLLAFALVLLAILFASWLLQDPCFTLAGIALDIVLYPFRLLSRKVLERLRPMRLGVGYERIPLQDFLFGDAPQEKDDEDDLDEGSEETSTTPMPMRWPYALVGVVLLAQVVCLVGRPAESALVFMSWTLPLVPFVDFLRSSSTQASAPIFNGSFHGGNSTQNWHSRTALAAPISLPWLPNNTLIAGFEDWYENKEHYSAAKDPLKISNLKEKLLPALRGKLADVKIQHVMLIELESTRQDVFPIKSNGLIVDSLAKSFGNRTMPIDIRRKLANLTNTASFLTGDYDAGFEHAHEKRRGGINIKNAHTMSTYTLKSMVAHLCGINPLVVDFNIEHKSHVYQPCLPHIFDAFNKLDDTQPKDGFTSFKWRSTFMQSATGTYDKQRRLMSTLGYPPSEVVHRQYLQSDSAKFGKVNVTDVGYNGIPETTLEDYITDAFRSAKKNNERLFLTHLTSTTHHPFVIPKDVEYIPFAEGKALQRLSNYLNTVGYVDRWLAKILSLLDKEGVADETLVIFVGDHGVSVPENGGVTPYYNPHVGNFHVPLVISHPALPQIDVNEAATSTQILPTILDLLLETESLSKSQAIAAQDLLRNYEGQSFLRPLQQFSKESGQANWLFTVMNPGGGMLAVRDARQPNLRLIVPLVEDLEWRFTDLGLDPHEKAPVLSFGFSKLLDKVEKKHGGNAARWIEEATSVTQWWIQENTRRWRYKPPAA